MTPPNPGAVAILQLLGGDVEPVLAKLTKQVNWPIGRIRLVDLGGIDEGLVARLNDRVTQIMPHGGPRVVQRLIARLFELGLSMVEASRVDPQQVYPEAADQIEALTLQTLARAASPLAIDLLLAQPGRWRAVHDSDRSLDPELRARSLRLNRLIDPPIVVLAGQPNVGKSTLSNSLLGRMMSIAADMPGTTRDFVAGRIDMQGLVVDWHDTPGLRSSSDPIEQKAIAIARRLMTRAALLVAMRDAEHDWPILPRNADVFVFNKVDRPTGDLGNGDGTTPDRAIQISALTGYGQPQLVRAIRDGLVGPAELAHPGPWLFDPRLIEFP